jgi:hypothetical protein
MSLYHCKCTYCTATTSYPEGVAASRCPATHDTQHVHQGHSYVTGGGGGAQFLLTRMLGRCLSQPSFLRAWSMRTPAQIQFETIFDTLPRQGLDVRPCKDNVACSTLFPCTIADELDDFLAPVYRLAIDRARFSPDVSCLQDTSRGPPGCFYACMYRQPALCLMTPRC